jgi:hypothetical protein
LTILPQTLVRRISAGLLLSCFLAPISSARESHAGEGGRSAGAAHPSRAAGALDPAMTAGAAELGRSGAIRQVSGATAQVKVPMVSEPWSATVGRVAPSAQREIPDFGDFPGVREWKRQANARRRALMHSKPGDGSAGLQPGSDAAPSEISNVISYRQRNESILAPSQGGVVFDGPGGR